MHCVKLIHWKSEEIDERTTILEAAGYDVDSNLPGGSQFFRQLGENPPSAIVIDLSRLPSQGRDFALQIRKRKTSRHIPLVFVGGAPQKVDPIKQLIPDASYTSWEEIDTGGSNKRHDLENELDRAGCQPGNLNLIVLTHGDFDHTGNAAYLRKKFGTKIAMHSADSGMAEQGDMFWNRNKPNFLIKLMT
ncbi:unnamed protein product, partial [marine sediment metagenome]